MAPDLPPFNQSPYFNDAVQAMVRIVITPVMTEQEEPEPALQELGTEVERGYRASLLAHRRPVSRYAVSGARFGRIYAVTTISPSPSDLRPIAGDSVG